MFVIIKDYLFTEGTDQSPVGLEVDKMPLYATERVLRIESQDLPDTGEMIAFRLRDDDGNLCYDGRLNDDPDCENQIAALRWGEAYAGATMILVMRNNEWIQEIT